MKARLMEASLWSLAALGVIKASLEWRQATHRAQEPVPAIWPLSVPEALIGADSLQSTADRIIGGDMFRLDRRPTSVAYGGNADTLGAPPQGPTPVRPPLTLAGIIGGPPWAALLDGVPGHDGTLVLHRGESVAGLTVRAISSDGITVAGMDTTWRLVVKRPWP